MVFSNIYNATVAESLILLVLLVIAGFLSFIWDLYFAKRIIVLFRLYRYCVEKAESDPFGNYIEAALHHKLDLIKYAFLMSINISEFLLMILYAISYVLANEPSSYENIYFPDWITTTNCTSELTNSGIFDLRLLYENPINAILQSIGKTGLILSLSLVICLMKFLHETFHNTNANPLRYIRSFLLVTSLVSVAMIITGSVPQLKMIRNMTDSIIHLVYFAIWVKHARTFSRTLKWRSLELRVRGIYNARLLRRATVNYFQFRVIMWCMGVSYVLVILALFMGEYFTLIATALYYGPCVFNYLYGTHYYKPLLTTYKQIETLHYSCDIGNSVEILLGSIAVFITVLQYLLSTLVFFGGIVINKLKYRFGCVRIRYTPSVTQHLLHE